jgi:hypothetical protein
MHRYSKVLVTSFLTLILAAPFLCGQEPGSHARIVRISYLEGSVQLNGERANMNSPVREGEVLRTQTDGLAEVQFEDGATIRMASETEITFAQLARLTSGEAITRVDLDDGEAEFLIPASSARQFAVNVRSKNLSFMEPGRYRILSTNASPLEIAVWKGEVTVRDRESGKEVAVKKNETFTLNPSDPGQYDLENALLADDLDQWSSMRDQTLAAIPPTVTSSYTSSNGYSSPTSLYSPLPYYPYAGVYNCFGWIDPFGNCFNGGGFGGFGGFYQPWFFPPTIVFIAPNPVFPHRPPHLRPPTVPTVAAAGAVSGTVPVRPGVRSFRFDQGFQRTFNEENFQGGAVNKPASGEAAVVPGHRSPGSSSAAPFTPIVTVAPRPNAPHAATPSASSRPSSPPAQRPASPAPSSGSRGFSGGSMPSHSAPSSSHSGGGGGRH